MSTLSGDTQCTTDYREDIQLLSPPSSRQKDFDYGESDAEFESELPNSRTSPNFRHGQGTSHVNLFDLGRRFWKTMSSSPLLRSKRSQEIRLYSSQSIPDLRSTSRARNRKRERRTDSSHATSSLTREARRESFLQFTSTTGIEVPAGHAGNLFDDTAPVLEHGDNVREAGDDLDEEHTGWNDRNPPDNSPFVYVLQSPFWHGSHE